MQFNYTFKNSKLSNDFLTEYMELEYVYLHCFPTIVREFQCLIIICLSPLNILYRENNINNIYIYES